MLKNLVISADSVIGGAICNAIGAVGTTRRSPTLGRVPFDLTSENWLPDAVRVYFCSGINGFKECERDPERARFVNVECTVKHAKRIVSDGCEVVLLSSCAAETHPDSVYGSLKRETEDALLKLEGVSIFRFGPVMFEGRNTYANKDYHPISLERLIDTVTGPFVPGLHRVLNTPVDVLV